MKKTVLAVTFAAALAVSPSPNPNNPRNPNIGIDTTVGTDKGYKGINVIAKDTNNAIAASRDQASGLANPTTTKMLEENLAEEPGNTTGDKESYTYLIDEKCDNLDSNDEKEGIKPANYYVIRENGRVTGYLVGDSKNAAKTYYTPEEINLALKIMIQKEGANVIVENGYSVNENTKKQYGKVIFK